MLFLRVLHVVSSHMCIHSCFINNVLLVVARIALYICPLLTLFFPLCLLICVSDDCLWIIGIRWLLIIDRFLAGV